MRSALPLYDALASRYEDHFAVPHRRAYDELAWEISTDVLPAPPAVLVDVGCGVGRWAKRLVAVGYHVIGVEPAHGMAERAARNVTDPAFTLLRRPVEDVELEPGSVDAVLAMGSLQYTDEPVDTLARCARWLSGRGVLCALVDSLHALVLELLASGRAEEAFERLATRRGLWRMDGHEAELHLLDRAGLEAAVVAAGLRVERVAGLLVGASGYGQAGLLARLAADYLGQLAVERRLASLPEIADLGKQLLIVARKPAR